MAGYSSNNWQQGGEHEQQSRSLRHDSNFVGFITLSQTILLQVIFIILVYVLKLIGAIESFNQNYYGLGNTGFLILYGVAYTIGMGLPAPIVALIAGRRINPFSRIKIREQRKLGFHFVILALLAGLSICILANFAASYILYFLENIGLKRPAMPDYMEKNYVSLIINIVVFALLPAIFEEMVYRGYILRTLRPYGDFFAVLVSSILFALMHGNILQIPFAFLVGLACGYLAVKTGHIWIAVILHFLNNFMSTLLSYAGLYLTTEQNQKMILIVFSLIGMIGLVAIVILYAMGDPIIRRQQSHPQQMASSRLAGSLLLAPAMIASLVIFLLLTVVNTLFGGTA